MGPVSSKGQYDSILAAIEKAQLDGAELIFGGGPTQGMKEGITSIQPFFFKCNT